MYSKSLKRFNLSNKTVLLRSDLNVPIKDQEIIDDFRIKQALPTIQYILSHGARLVIISHLGNPKEKDANYSLNPIAKHLEKLLNEIKNPFLKKNYLYEEVDYNLEHPSVYFSNDSIGKEVDQMILDRPYSSITLLENLRFYPEEKNNDYKFAINLAKSFDIYINDAFSCCHREHSSITQLPKILPSAAGLLLLDELRNLNKTLSVVNRPFMAIIGGAKVSTKLSLLYNLVTKTDILFIAGAMANTFLAAENNQIGDSLYESAYLQEALNIMQLAKENNCCIILPSDVVVRNNTKKQVIIDIKDIQEHDIIFDVGPRTIQNITDILSRCSTVVWNGPLGAYEYSPFDVATKTLATNIVTLTQTNSLISVAGGGDLIASLRHTGLLKSFTYVSAGGGAFLQWLEKETMPGISALADNIYYMEKKEYNEQ